MSSSVHRKDRTQRAPRLSLEDFSLDEQEIIEIARGWFPGQVAVFGSRARGDWAEDSDLDLGLKGYSFLLHKPAVAHINSVSKIKVDVCKFEHALTHKSIVIV